MSTFYLQIATVDNKVANVYVFMDEGDGSVVDCNHIQRTIDLFVKKHEAIPGRPPEGSKIFFEVHFNVSETHRGVSSYSNIDFRQLDSPPLNVIERGMYLYRCIKSAVRKASQGIKKKRR